MQQITVKHVEHSVDDIDINAVSLLLDSCEKHTLEFTPWQAFPYKPQITFSIAHNSSFIFLKFFVREKEIRAMNNKVNSSVWEDSCVEFFISFDDGKSYYNIEFNCIGTGLISYGKSKTERELLNESIVHQVNTLSTINAEKGKKVSWELTMVIPVEVFAYTPLSTLANKKCKANFYKCGDLLPEPHFVCWSNIKAENPNFHLPDFFGHLIFE